jgi:hypothetical protein
MVPSSSTRYGRSDFSGSWPQRSRLPLTAAASTDYFHELRSKSPSASRHSLGLKSAFQIDKSGLMWHTIATMAFLPLRLSWPSISNQNRRSARAQSTARSRETPYPEPGCSACRVSGRSDPLDHQLGTHPAAGGSGFVQPGSAPSQRRLTAARQRYRSAPAGV